jgi:FkbM family methyltransferase
LAPGLTVHAVEPLERHRRFLLENLALNGLSDSDVTIHDEGISSSPGTENFLDWGYGSRLRRAEKENKPSLSMRWRAMLVLLGIGKKESSKAVVPIRTITLDTLLDRIDRIVDLVQMDVQGLEVEVLEGGVHSMETARVQAYLIGTHSLKIHRECSAILEEHGYVIEFDKSDTKDQPDGILVAKRKS